MLTPNREQRQTYGGIQSAVSVSLPAPIGGWNTRDPLAMMEPLDAITLQNWFPGTEGITVRRGYASHATGLGSGLVPSLFSHAAADGTETLIGCANGNIYDATSTGAASSLYSTSITNNQWYAVQFRHVMILANGDDQPLQFDGSTVSTAAYTGISDDSVLTAPAAHKSRLYFVEKNKASYWYADAVNTLTGGITEEDISSLLQRGGYILATASWNWDAGDGINNYFVIVTNMGEVFIYEGSYPGDSAWKLITHGYIGKPLGRNCFLRLSAELFVITDQGITPLSQLFAQNQRGSFEMLSDKINSQFRKAATLYRDNPGWQAVNYPEGEYALFNVPTTTSMAEQYVMNTITGSWCRFTGQDAMSWALHDNRLYFGSTDGVVYMADFGETDDGGSIPIDLKTSFSYYGDKVRNKRFSLGRPVFKANGPIKLAFDVDVDFENASQTETITSIMEGVPGPAWDAIEWDTTGWGVGDQHNYDWYSLNGVGRAAAIRLRGNALNLSLELSAIDVTFIPGGLV